MISNKLSNTTCKYIDINIHTQRTEITSFFVRFYFFAIVSSPKIMELWVLKRIYYENKWLEISKDGKV